jgi:hypothetical protein
MTRDPELDAIADAALTAAPEFMVHAGGGSGGCPARLHDPIQVDGRRRVRVRD